MKLFSWPKIGEKIHRVKLEGTFGLADSIDSSIKQTDSRALAASKWESPASLVSARSIPQFLVPPREWNPRQRPRRRALVQRDRRPVLGRHRPSLPLPLSFPGLTRGLVLLDSGGDSDARRPLVPTPTRQAPLVGPTRRPSFSSTERDINQASADLTKIIESLRPIRSAT
jgi:hypothetical protein